MTCDTGAALTSDGGCCIMVAKFFSREGVGKAFIIFDCAAQFAHTNSNTRCDQFSKSIKFSKMILTTRDAFTASTSNVIKTTTSEILFSHYVLLIYYLLSWEIPGRKLIIICELLQLK